MTAVDTSALVVALLREPGAAGVWEVLEGEDQLLISAVTVAEALVVASRRDFGTAMQGLLAKFPWQVAPTTEAVAQRIGAIYQRWGRGAGTAGLNFADCFAYEVASSNGCPLLYVSKDFAKTDVRAAIRAR